jgi:branched-chain amino acid transport system substrate-binding protein
MRTLALAKGRPPASLHCALSTKHATRQLATHRRLGTRWGLPSLLVAALALVLSGCSSSGSPSSASSTGSSSAKPVVFGAIVDETGPAASGNDGFVPGLQAWADWTNAHGGISGRQVKLIILDSQTNPTTALSDARKLVADGAVAITSANGEEPEFQSYIDSAHVPVIGGIEGAAYWGTDPNWFADGTTLNAPSSELAIGIKTGHSKLALFYCTEEAACAQDSVPLAAEMTALGGSVVGKYAVSATAANYTSECLAAKAAGANFTFVIDYATVTARVATDCAAQNFTPEYVFGALLTLPVLLHIAALNGSYVAFNTVPQFASPSVYPGLKNYLAALNKYEPGYTSNANYGAPTITGWVTGLLLQDGLAAAQVPASQAVTSPNVVNGLLALKADTLTGLTGPLTFTKSGKYVFSCYFLAQIQNGQYVAKGNAPICPAS